MSERVVIMWLCVKSISYNRTEFVKGEMYKSSLISKDELYMYGKDGERIDFFIEQQDRNRIKLNDHFIRINNIKISKILFT